MVPALVKRAEVVSFEAESCDGACENSGGDGRCGPPAAAHAAAAAALVAADVVGNPCETKRLCNNESGEKEQRPLVPSVCF